MNRNLKIQLFALFLLVAAALVGCGGGEPAAQIQINDGPDAKTDIDQPDNQTQPDADAKDSAPEADKTDADAEPDAEAGDEGQVCNDKPCASCSPEGTKSLCSALVCQGGQWIDVSDGGIVNAPCTDPDAGDAQPDQVNPGQDAEAGNDVDADPPADADASPEADAPIQTDTGTGGAGGSDGDSGSGGFGSTSTGGSGGTSGSGGTAGMGGTGGDAGTIDVQPLVEICGNGIDDDGNGLTDCADPACVTYISCQPEICNGIDDNGNGLIDENQPCIFGSIQNCTTIDGAGQKSCIKTPGNLTVCMWGACNVPCINAVPGDFCAAYSIGTWSCGHTWRCNCNKVWDDPNGGGFTCLNPPDAGSDGAVCDEYVGHACTTMCGYSTCASPQLRCNSMNQWDVLVADFSYCVDGGDAGTEAATPAEICNGIDDNGNGLIDENQPCVFNTYQSCTTACGSSSQAKCIKDPGDTTKCKLDTCQPADKELNCSDGKDDDCDGYIDCNDPDCWGTSTCPHNFGTCSALQTGDGLNCTSWVKETLPTGADRQFACCANSANDKFCLTGDYNDIMLIRSTGGAWSQVTLPVTGDVNGGSDILCLGTNQVYMVYNRSVGTGGVLAKWDGTNVVELAIGQVSGKIGPMFGNSSTDIRFVAYDGMWDNPQIKHWDGSALTSLPLPSFGSQRILAADLWGWTMQDLYLAGSLDDQGLLMHFDGTTWARIATPIDIATFDRMDGTSSCDVMVTGYNHTSPVQGITLQRNGNTWDQKTYTSLSGISSVTKASPTKYLLMSAYDMNPGTCGMVGTSNGDFTVNWTQPDPDPLDFPGGWVAFHVPGTQTYYLTGDNAHFLMHADCQ